MSFTRATRAPSVPTPPRGEQIAAYDTYLEAQKAVDHLSDKEFPVQNVTIVGTDLKMVERVTGRLTYSRVALAGLASGAWFGLFVGLVLSLFSSPDAGGLPIFSAIAIGAAFGILFSVISYAFTGGKRDFTSSSQIVATTYAVLCAIELAHQARGVLTGPDGPGLGRAGTAGAVPPAQPQQPPTAPAAGPEQQAPPAASGTDPYRPAPTAGVGEQPPAPPSGDERPPADRP